MEQVAEKVQQEYWRPVAEHHTRATSIESRSRLDVCEGCGSEFVVGARFCHVCGGGRQAAATNYWNRWAEALDFDHIRQILGLTAASLVAFIFGLISVGAAIAVGFIYSANTLVDWQAVQTWRIEWMLAAVVAFVAGILLKKNEQP